MKKCVKGNPGYLHEKLKMEILRTLLYFAIVAGVFFLGYSQTHTRKNLLTVVAVVGCLPASKALVGVLTRIPYHTIDGALAQEIAAKTPHLTVIYDLILTSTEKIMPIDCMVIFGNTVFGYTSGKKVNPQYATSHVREMLRQSEMTGISVKIFDQYQTFLTRVEGLENIAAVEKESPTGCEQRIAELILNLSL